MSRQWGAVSVYWVAVTLVVAGLTHLASVLALPFRSADDAYARVAATASGALLATVGPLGASRSPYQDPTMASAVCLFDLRQGPVAAGLDVGDADFAMLSVHGRHGRVLYGLTNRSATQHRLGLLILTGEQAARRPPSDSAAAADIRVEVDEPEGFVLAQALATMPTAMGEAVALVAGLTCRAAGT